MTGVAVERATAGRHLRPVHLLHVCGFFSSPPFTIVLTIFLNFLHAGEHVHAPICRGHTPGQLARTIAEAVPQIVPPTCRYCAPPSDTGDSHPQRADITSATGSGT